MVKRKHRIRSAERWNETYPQGIAVVYTPPLPLFFKFTPLVTRTCAMATCLSDGTPVVKIEGVTGWVALEHLAVLEERDNAS